jgi:hypothetical protein
VLVSVVRVRPGIRWVSCSLCAGCAALAAAAGATAAGTSGVSAPDGPSGPLPSAGALTVAPTSLSAGQVVVASGALPAAQAGQTVWLEVQSGISWATVARGPIARGGKFAITWRPQRTGKLTLRAATAGPDPNAASAATAPPTATPDATLAVYRQVLVTWYGPGLYGRQTACGERLTRTIVGVADRTLPCGTPVSLRYRGHTLVAPVIDRGPYGTGAVLDLTHAAAEELGVTETVPVGMIVLGGPPLTATNWSPPPGPTGSNGGTPAPDAGGTTPGTGTR